MIQIGEKTAGIDAPLEHLIACHRRIEERLSSLVRAGGELERGYEAPREAIAAAVRFLDSNGALHTEDEEASLFPRLRAGLSPEEMAYVESLGRQHQAADQVYAELKAVAELLSGEIRAFRELAGRLQGIYREHITSEEATLLPLARRSLDARQLQEISGEMKQRRAGLMKPVAERTPCLTA